MFIEILNKIKEFNRIIIHRHQRPDGDCMGSQMGLKHLIKNSFPEKEVYAVGDEVPAYLSELGQIDVIPDEYYKDALVIIVDTSVEKRICDDRWTLGKYIIKIDHHDDSPDFGDLIYVDNTSPACSSIIVSMIKAWGDEVQINKESAYALYFGITTDTGRFRYRGLSSEVLNNAGFLIDQGIDVDTLYNKLYIDEVATLKLQGYVLNNFKTTENGVAYIYFTKKMMDKFGVSKDDAANLVNSISTIKGCLVWVAFVDQNGIKPEGFKKGDLDPSKEIRCRLRSRGVAVNGVAANYRGGGHLQAAGATIYSRKEMNAILNELDALVKEYKKEHPDAF
ncbi:MAG: bifunctional oligoribonuclease/PAP phosphatase NrnA [Bacilli bacterium]|nr:bifunctional oligoribonuclease/PAP phosphatase NrnA [Bacilli bacterium]